ncbi:macrolide export ATP-binding/permease protein MacB [bacterium BMS3Abin01]|nr:macrolide export ATP-binding/permease protein MacB [bacterium BMS3Abin01]
MKRLGLLYLAAQNLRRKPFRSFVTIAIVAIAAGTLFSATLLISSVNRSLEVGMERLGADILVVPEGSQESGEAALITGVPTSFYMERSVADQVAAVQGVDQVSPQLFIESLISSACCTGHVQLVGYDPDTDFVITPWLEQNVDKPLDRDDVVIGSLILANKGETVKFYGHDFNVVGILDATGMGADESVFMTLDAAYAMADESAQDAATALELQPGQISSVLVRVAPGTTIEQVAQRIKTSVPGTLAITANELSRSVTDRLSGFLKGFIVLDIIVWIMALLTIAAIFSMIVNERQREIGLLRAMGGKRGYIFRLMTTEAILLTAAGGLTGVLLGGAGMFIFRAVITASLGIPYLWPPLWFFALLVLGTLFLSVVSGVVASLYPAISSSRLEPYAAIRKGE